MNGSKRSANRGLAPRPAAYTEDTQRGRQLIQRMYSAISSFTISETDVKIEVRLYAAAGCGILDKCGSMEWEEADGDF